MPPPLTGDERGVPEWARIVNWPGFASPNRGTDARGTPARDTRGGGLAQEPPYAGRQGPLMKMLGALQREGSRPERLARENSRAVELEARERERDLLVKKLPSVVGGARARFLHSEHQQRTKRDKTYGIGWGVEWLPAYAREKSGWGPDKVHDTPERRALYWRYYREKEAALKERGLEEVSCLTMMEKSLPNYVRAAGQVTLSKERQLDVEEVLRQAVEKAKDARGEGEIGAKGSKAVYGGRATVLLEELRARLGFETVYIDAEPKEGYEKSKGYRSANNYTSFKEARAKGKVPAVKADVIGADSHKEIDARVKLDRFVDLAKLTPSSRVAWDELNTVEFAVGVADSGFHTFVVSGGMVYEVHWNRGPDDPRLTSSKPLKSFFKVHTTGLPGEWGSGVIAVPPGVLTREKPAPERKRRETR